MTGLSRAIAPVACALAWAAPSLASPADIIQFQCLPPPQTRDLLQTQAFIRPFRAMIVAARSGQGEPIGIRMCRYNGQVVYMVHLLRRDGELMRFLVDAQKGDPLDPQPPLPPPGGPRSLLGRIPVLPDAPPEP